MERAAKPSRSPQDADSKSTLGIARQASFLKQLTTFRDGLVKLRSQLRSNSTNSNSSSSSSSSSHNKGDNIANSISSSSSSSSSSSASTFETAWLFPCEVSPSLDSLKLKERLQAVARSRSVEKRDGHTLRKQVVLPPDTVPFRHVEMEASKPWAPYTHPNGIRYYRCDYKRMTFLTYTNMSDPALPASAQNAMKLLHALWKRTKDTRGRLHKLLEVVIDLSPDQTDTPRWEYYCIMHMQRELFWLEHTVRETFINTVNDTSANDFIGWESAPHIQEELRTLYWEHIALFATTLRLNESEYRLFYRTLVQAAHDHMLGIESQSPYNLAEIQQMLVWTPVIDTKEKISQYYVQAEGYAMNVIAQVLAEFGWERIRRATGRRPYSRDTLEHAAALNRRTLLIRVVSPLCFFAPDVHLNKLKSLLSGRIIRQGPWDAYLKDQKEDWRDLTVMATVLLAVDTALLAIPTIDSGFQSTRSAAQMLAYLSTISSVGAILTAFLLIRQYHIKATTSTEAVELLHGTGLERMAILQSLPHTFAMWSMSFFLCSFAALVFTGTTIEVRLIFGFALFFVFFLVFWVSVDQLTLKYARKTTLLIDKLLPNKLEWPSLAHEPARSTATSYHTAQQGGSVHPINQSFFSFSSRPSISTRYSATWSARSSVVPVASGAEPTPYQVHNPFAVLNV